MVFEGFNYLLLLLLKLRIAPTAGSLGTNGWRPLHNLGHSNMVIPHSWWRFVMESILYELSVVPRIQGRLNSSVAQRQTALRVYTAARFCSIRGSIEHAAAGCFPSCPALSQGNKYSRHSTTGSDGRRHWEVWWWCSAVSDCLALSTGVAISRDTEERHTPVDIIIIIIIIIIYLYSN